METLLGLRSKLIALLNRRSKSANLRQREIRRAYSLLITGQKAISGNPGAIEQTYGNLRAQIEDLLDEYSKLDERSDQSFRTIGPFISRSLLEVSLTALLGRLDPFRLLALRQIQLQPTYAVGERVMCAIQWTGDILPREKCTNPWSTEREFAKMPRALLSEPYEQLFWADALLKLIDFDQTGKGGDWIAALKSQDPEKFISRAKGELSILYSSLSKGVHHELLIPPNTIYTREAVESLFEDSVRWSSLLATMLSFTEHCYNPVQANDALQLVEEIQTHLYHA